MCGISGIINKNNKPVDKNEIKKINDLIEHRGPDDEGFYFGKNFAFGHRRLSIIDLSENGQQPMCYRGKNGEYVITYNGEIYNYLEIKKQLISEGYKFKSDTDTEVILASYDKWGEECVNRFDGMWSFAIFDKGKNIIFCSRDRFGIKPFYYTNVNNKFIFGSEIKQLLEYYPERYVNKKILIDYLVVGILEHTNETFFENIYKLEQSHNLIYDLTTHRFYFKKYFDIKINENIKQLNLEQSIKLYKKKFINSINLRLRSDVKVATCLSGGLDSSSIAVFASKIYRKKSNQNFTAIHAKSIENQTDESHYAKEVASYCNLDLKIVEPKTKEFLDDLKKVIYIQEEPFGSPSIYMQYRVMKLAKEVGCKVMLDGQGGDETLLGYNRYYVLYIQNILKNRPIDIFKKLKQIQEKSSLSLYKILFYFFGMKLFKLRLILHKKQTFFIKKEYYRMSDYSYLQEISKSSNNDKKLQLIEIMKTNLPELLRYEDKNSMYCSVETRLPFLNYNCVQYAISLPIEYKINNGWLKYILRKTVDKVLPPKIVWRKNKFAFEAPTNVWLTKLDPNIIKESLIIKEISNIDNIMRNFQKIDNKVKWRLFNIALWEKVYNVKIN